MVVSALIVNVYLAVVARALRPAEYATFGSFWALALVVGFGFFLPLEQQLAQRLALAGSRRAVLRAALVVAGMLTGVALALLLVLSPLVWRALDHDVAAFAALVALCVVSAAQFLLRGTLIGTDRLVRHGAVMVLDALVRLGLALVVLVLSGSAAAFCWALVVAIAAAHVPVLPGAWRRAAEGPDGPDGSMSGRVLARASMPLLVGSACAQLLLNGLPVVVVAASTVPGDEVAAGIFVAAFTLMKAPLSMVVPLQSAVVPTLTRLIAADRRREVVRLLGKGAAALGALIVVGVPLVWFLGPGVIALVYGSDYAIGSADLVLILLGVLVHVALVILTQVHVARGRHTDVGVSWALSLLAAAVTFLAVPRPVLAAETAFLVGSATGAVVSCVILSAARRRHGVS